MTDVDGILKEFEDDIFTPSQSDGESDAGPPNLILSDPTSSLEVRDPDRSGVVKEGRKSSTDPKRTSTVGLRRGSRYLLSESSDEESPTFQGLKKVPVHKKVRRKKSDGFADASGLFVGGTPSTSARMRKNKSVPCQSADKEQDTPQLTPRSDKGFHSGTTLISAQLGEIANLLQNIDKRVTNTEKELKSIKTKLRSSTSSSESSSKDTIALVVRVRTLHIVAL